MKHILDLDKFPEYQYKAIMGHVETQNKELAEVPMPSLASDHH